MPDHCFGAATVTNDLLIARILANNSVTLSQVVFLDLAERDIHIGGSRQVALGAHEGIVIEDVQDATNGNQNIIICKIEQLGTSKSWTNRKIM